MPKKQVYKMAGIVSAGTFAAKRYIQNFRNKVFVIGIPRELGRSSYKGCFFDWSALKMTKYEEKLKYLNWSANCSSRKVLSVNPQ